MKKRTPPPPPSRKGPPPTPKGPPAPPTRKGPPAPPPKKSGAKSKRPSRPPPPPPPGNERRAHQRYELLAQVQITRQSEVHILSTSNISRGGFFICADPEAGFTPEVGAELDVLLFSPDELSHEISARAKVMRLVEGKGGCVQGYGLRFESFRAGDLLHFDELLALLKG